MLESTLVEVEEKENSAPARLSLLPACPLPSAVYKVYDCQALLQKLWPAANPHSRKSHGLLYEPEV